MNYIKTFSLAVFGVLILSWAYAKPNSTVDIIFTGDTHAMLYTCSCPVERSGGVARRATVIKGLRNINSRALLLDCGSYFSGGLYDEYTQNTALDMQRALVNLKAMKIMGYDAVGLAEDEFNFGKDFFFNSIKDIKVPVVSSNVKSQGVSPYLIKDIGGVKFAIVGLTSPASKQKAEGVVFDESKPALESAVKEARDAGAQFVIMLSRLSQEENAAFLKLVSGIDILISSRSANDEPLLSKIDSTIVVKTSWQGRKLGKLSLDVDAGKIITYKAEELPLIEEIASDRDILSVLPRCFADRDCRTNQARGICQNPGNISARCQLIKPEKIKLAIVAPKSCKVCETQRVVKSLKTALPGLQEEYVFYPSPKANELLKKADVSGLPVYFLGKEVEKDKAFINLKDKLEDKGGYYLVKQGFAGISYFPGRENIKSRFDVFFSLYDKDASGLLVGLKEFNPDLHFLVTQKDGNFNAGQGVREVEESLRSVCVQKYYPQAFWGYLTCRAANVDSSWWQDCLSGLDPVKIESCARGKDGAELLYENTKLNRELNVYTGPTALLDNQEIFSFKGVPDKDILKKIVR